MIRRLLNRVSASIKTYGLFESVFWLIFGYFRVNEFYIYLLSVTDALSADSGAAASLWVKRATDEDIVLLQRSRDFKTPDVYIRSYLKASRCLIGFSNGEPAHIMWVFLRGDDSRLFCLNDGEAELNYCYTPPRFRGTGIYSEMIRAAARMLKEDGITRCYMATHRTNTAAQKAIDRAGLKKIGAIKQYGIFFRPKWK